MKIALVYDLIYPYSIGGVEKRNWEVGKRLAQRGHTVTLFGARHWAGSDIIHREGVRLWGVGIPHQLYVNGRRCIKGPIRFSLDLVPPLAKERFDIIDAANFPYFPCFSAKLASVIKHSRLIITWHEVWNNYWTEYLGRKGVFGKFIERATIQLTDKMIAVSEGTRVALANLGTKRPVEVIPNGIDFGSIAKVTPSQTKSQIIYSGRMIKDKNVDLLVRAVKTIKESMPDVSCIIIGDGPEREHLINLTQELKLTRNIHFEHFFESQLALYSCMKGSRVFVLPSTREGFGISAIEANACGLPVVTVLSLSYLLIPSQGLTGAGLAWTLGQTLIALVIGAIIIVPKHKRPGTKQSSH